MKIKKFYFFAIYVLLVFVMVVMGAKNSKAVDREKDNPVVRTIVNRIVADTTNKFGCVKREKQGDDAYIVVFNTEDYEYKIIVEIEQANFNIEIRHRLIGINYLSYLSYNSYSGGDIPRPFSIKCHSFLGYVDNKFEYFFWNDKKRSTITQKKADELGVKHLTNIANFFMI